MKLYMAHLEQEKIGTLLDNFLKTIDRIEELFYMNDDSYMILIEMLKTCLSGYKIRNEKVFTRDFCRENNDEYDLVTYQSDVENLYEETPRRGLTYLQLIENIVPKKDESSDCFYISNDSHNLPETEIQIQAREMQIYFEQDNDFNQPYKKRKFEVNFTILNFINFRILFIMIFCRKEMKMEQKMTTPVKSQKSTDGVL